MISETKNIKIGAFLVLLYLAFNSCDIIQENPQSDVTSENFYQNETDAISAINAIYGQLNATSFPQTPGPYFHSYFLINGFASDEMVNIQGGLPGYDQLEQFNHGPVNNLLREHWESTYRAIYLANVALANVPSIEMNEDLKDRLLREAHFLRGTLYFDLVRLFGSVPLLLGEHEPLDPVPASMDDIYAQLISDIQMGELLPETYPAGDGLGRATRYAAKGLLARVYRTLGEWENSADKAFEVIESEHDLWDDFADVFRIAHNNGREAVFSIGFGDAGGAISFWEPGQFNIRFLPSELREQIPGVNAVGAQGPTQDLYDSYDPDDARREVTFITEVTDISTGETIELSRPYFRKWWDEEGEPDAGATSNDFPHIRYSDVLLMYAEAQAELGNFGDANDYLNMVRGRANLDDVEINNIDEFRDAILQERRWEFAAEGHRWFDLVHHEKLEELVPLAKENVIPQPHHYVFPIPQREMDLNQNLQQNNGY